jgi:ribosomal protein S18 acetylase RimI-like enzyme
VDHWGGNADFACVLAYDGDEAVGFAYGAPAVPGREWWREHLDQAPEKAVTFSYSELSVSPDWRKKGVADLLSRALLEGRDEDLAVLLVDVEHPRVQALYEDWGFRKVGERQPFPDSPVYAVMLAELPLSS